MKRMLILITLCVVFPMSAFASDYQRALKKRWLGAWVVTTVEMYSNCGGAYTRNRVNGRLVNSQGRHRFQPGELAKVEKLDAKRRRVDLQLSIAEPLLVSRQEGPFTLYDEVNCRLELEVEVPRQMVKDKDVGNVDRLMAPVLERFPTLEVAQRADRWNQREREPYPDDYDRTLAEYAVWTAERHNARVEARIGAATEETTALAERMTSDPAYLVSFAKGVEAGKQMSLGSCSKMLALDITKVAKTVSKASHQYGTAPSRADRGFQDGKRLVVGLKLMQRLPECYVEVPEGPTD